MPGVVVLPLTDPQYVPGLRVCEVADVKLVWLHADAVG